MSDQDDGPQYPTYPGDGADGFESYPRGPEDGSAAARPAPQAPKPIIAAVRLMWVGAAISLIGIVSVLTRTDELRDRITESLQDSDPNVTQSTIDTAVSASIAGAVISGIIGVLLWLWMAWKNGQGRSWARVVATVLGGINLLQLVVTLSVQETTGLSMILLIVNLVLAAGILVLLWRKESSQYYSDVTQSQVIG